jgi:hypothetical protein
MAGKWFDGLYLFDSSFFERGVISGSVPGDDLPQGAPWQASIIGALLQSNPTCDKMPHLRR